MSLLKKTIRERHLESASFFDDRSSSSPTLTVPDESMSVPYILARYTKGLPINVQKVAVDYQVDNFDSPDWEKVKNMDLVDHDDLREELAEIEEAANQQKEKRKRKKAETISGMESPASEPAPSGAVTGSEEGTGSAPQK